MKWTTNAPQWFGVILLAIFTGCGTPETASIQGRVTYDGMPVDLGSIIFLPETKDGAIKVAAPIENGEYKIPPERGAKAGRYRVEISWSKKTGKQVPSADPGMMHEEVQEALPPRFNTESTLTRDLVLGENLLNFELQSK